MVKIGSLRYDIVADTANFQKGMTATRRELREAKKVFAATRTPAERLGTEIEDLSALFRKGAISADTYNRRIKQLKHQHALAAGGIKGMVAQFKRVPGAVKGAAAAYIGLASAMRAVRAIGQRMQEIDEAAKAARKLGETTEELIGLQLAAEEFSGFTDRQLNMALQRMTRRISEAAAGTGEARAALVELGLDAARLNMLSPAAAFREVSDSMRGVGNESDQLRLAFKLFDSEGAGLVTTLNAGSAGLLEMRDRAMELGLAVSDIDAQQIERANDAITEAKAAFAGFGNQLAVHFAPAIEYIADLMQFNNGLIEQYRESWNNMFDDVREFLGVRTIGNTPGTQAAPGANAPRPAGMANGQEISHLEEVKQLRQEIWQGKRDSAAASLEAMSAEVKELELQVKLYGRSKHEQTLLRFEAQGITREEAKQAVRLQKNLMFYEQILAKQKQMTELADRGKEIEDALRESLRTPFDDLVDQLAELDLLVKVGAIDTDTRDRAAEEAEKKFSEDQAKPVTVQFPPTIRAESREEARILAQIRNKQQSKEAQRFKAQQKLAQAQLDATKETNRRLAALEVESV